MGQPIYLFVALVVGLFVGAGIIWLILRALSIRLTEQLIASQQDTKRLTSELDALAVLRNQITIEKQKLNTEIAKLTTTLELERSQVEEKLEFRKNAEEQLTNRFKILASEILDDKSRKFTDQNKINLDQLLEPLKIKITEFQGKVQEVYIQEGKDRSALSEQVKQLMALNNQLSEDAHNLTRALKGGAKVQGNWGELIL
ncbi:MAG: DNA recombination protein RmuC, partial [Betaproteobacteria bacterium]|nr:DNA recombination protein RmuC [Betaproteobacteria bacterium]